MLGGSGNRRRPEDSIYARISVDAKGPLLENRGQSRIGIALHEADVSKEGKRRKGGLLFA